MKKNKYKFETGNIVPEDGLWTCNDYFFIQKQLSKGEVFPQADIEIGHDTNWINLNSADQSQVELIIEIDRLLAQYNILKWHYDKSNYNSLKNYFLVHDAMSYRLSQLGECASAINEILNNREEYEVFYLLATFDHFRVPYDDLPERIFDDENDYDSVKDSIKEVKSIRKKLVKTLILDSVNPEDPIVKKDLPFSTDYKYAIKSNQSLWTVRKK